jgi:hypothetical protein
VPSVQHSVKSLFAESLALPSAALGKAFFAECPTKSTRQSLQHSAKPWIPVVAAPLEGVLYCYSSSLATILALPVHLAAPLESVLSTFSICIVVYFYIFGEEYSCRVLYSISTINHETPTTFVIILQYKTTIHISLALDKLQNNLIRDI